MNMYSAASAGSAGAVMRLFMQTVFELKMELGEHAHCRTALRSKCSGKALTFNISKNHGPKFAVTGLALRSIPGDALHHIASSAGWARLKIIALLHIDSHSLFLLLLSGGAAGAVQNTPWIVRWSLQNGENIISASCTAAHSAQSRASGSINCRLGCSGEHR